MADDLDPRFHHYFLAHIAFRSIAHMNPLLFFGALVSPEKLEFLGSVLDSIEEDNVDKEVLDFTKEDLKIHTMRIQNFPTAIIEFPTPQRMTEVFFVAAVLKEDGEVTEGETPEVDYITLEKGMEADGTDRTVLGAWDKEGGHLNYGDGPEPTLENFVSVVDQMQSQ